MQRTNKRMNLMESQLPKFTRESEKYSRLRLLEVLQELYLSIVMLKEDIVGILRVNFSFMEGSFKFFNCIFCRISQCYNKLHNFCNLDFISSSKFSMFSFAISSVLKGLSIVSLSVPLY